MTRVLFYFISWLCIITIQFFIDNLFRSKSDIALLILIVAMIVMCIPIKFQLIEFLYSFLGSFLVLCGLFAVGGYDIIYRDSPITISPVFLGVIFFHSLVIVLPMMLSLLWRYVKASKRTV